MEVFSQKIKESLSQADDTELQLKLQAAQHEHELRMMSLFTQFLAGRQPHQPPIHPSTNTQSSSYPDHVHLPWFGPDYTYPVTFPQDRTGTTPRFHRSDVRTHPSFYEEYSASAPPHCPQPPFFGGDERPLLPLLIDTPPPPTFTNLQPPSTHQAHISSQPIGSAQQGSSTLESASPQLFQEE
ncbi:hypothetical protein ABVT39_022816 [Epinephelus coioides]